MKENNKEKIVGVAGTLLFHAALFLLLYFLVIRLLKIDFGKQATKRK